MDDIVNIFLLSSLRDVCTGYMKDGCCGNSRLGLKGRYIWKGLICKMAKTNICLNETVMPKGSILSKFHPYHWSCANKQKRT